MKDEQEIKVMIERIGVARKAILEDLNRRMLEGDKTVQRNDHSQGIDDDGEPSDYVSGAGKIPCPVCKTGELRYARSSYNGHVHAACRSETCVRWME